MGNEELKVLIFSVGGQLYAADIVDIERILAYQEPARIPEAPDFVEGIINHEGTIIPVMSLSRRFNLEKDDTNSRESKIILSLFEGNKIGIAVDSVVEVKTLSDRDVDETPELVSGISRRYIKGIIKLKGSMAILINLSAILTEDEKEQI
ncbi:MAG: cheW [Firmicutes bacterium]|nr:cheW [Bacillota bacterium]